jgi:hypothetical protein
VLALAGEDSAVLQALDVLSGNADLHHAEIHFGLSLGQVYGLSNGADGFFNVADYAAEYAYAVNFSNAKDFEFSMCIPAPC